METADLKAEEALISSIWIGQNLTLLERLETNDFTDEFLQWLLLLLKMAVDSGEPLDMIPVLRRARKPELLERLPKALQAEVPYMIGKVLQQESTSAHAELYFKIVRAARINRGLLGLSAGIKERLNKRHEPEAVLSFVELNVEKLRERLI